VPDEIALVQSQDYVEYLSIRPIPALDSAHDLLIESQWRSAADPDGRQKRHRIVITDDALRGLLRHLQHYLQQVDCGIPSHKLNGSQAS